MTTKEVIISLSKQAGITQEQLAFKLGYKSQSNIAALLSRNDGMSIKLETLIKWLEELNAQLVVQPLNGDDDLILDGDDEGICY